jgi:hypothetical protein
VSSREPLPIRRQSATRSGSKFRRGLIDHDGVRLAGDVAREQRSAPNRRMPIVSR